MTTANQEIIAELRRVLGERDEHKAKREEYAAEARSLRERLKDAYRERDEAREDYQRILTMDGTVEERIAEFRTRVSEARAKAEARQARENAEREALRARVAKLEEERDEARAEVAAAYRRGAEAMREAAHQACLRVSRSESYYSPNVGDECADAVRALPIPEER